MSHTVFSRDPFPAKQFVEARQQVYTSFLGMWAFLASEVLFIGVIFTGFFLYRSLYTADFAEAARGLHWILGGINTAVLLSSSMTMALAVESSRVGEKKQLLHYLSLTLGLGAVFLSIKSYEYFSEWKEHLIPGVHFSAAASDKTELFMSFYFTLTGIHAIHMVVGLALLLSVLLSVRYRALEVYRPHSVAVVGLYWHFVDVVWLFVFPCLYLLRQA